MRVRAIDEFTLVIETERVAPSFLAKLALPYITPVPQAIVKQWGERWTLPENIVSNGPYKLVSRVNDQSIEMRINPYYSGKKPTISAIKMTVASGDICEAQLRAYEADEIDFATCIPIQDIPRVRKDPVLSTQLIANAESGTCGSSMTIPMHPGIARTSGKRLAWLLIELRFRLWLATGLRQWRKLLSLRVSQAQTKTMPLREMSTPLATFSQRQVIRTVLGSRPLPSQCVTATRSR
ncbi:hypothetical protein T190_31355 [Sinorhizobium meliloti CCBAU 01290]|nr:hypothetical protein T190_31355 [Sinorhizobium meliloti CCBAU 01290]